MSNDKTGGQAFPVWELNGQGKAEMTDFGMTLRDYFAAKAPIYTDQWFNDYVRNRGYRGYAEARSAWNYEYADAMLEARKS